MSKRTSAIYKSLENLEALKKRITELCDEGEINNMTETYSNVFHELKDINFLFSQELKTLKFWFDSLYHYNGKSTSISKKTASAKNGLKGGRPPKEISLMKKKVISLENEIIPEIKHKIVMSDSNEELACLEKLLKENNRELDDCKNKIQQWVLSKNRNA